MEKFLVLNTSVTKTLICGTISTPLSVIYNTNFNQNKWKEELQNH